MNRINSFQIRPGRINGFELCRVKIRKIMTLHKISLVMMTLLLLYGIEVFLFFIPGVFHDVHIINCGSIILKAMFHSQIPI